METVLYLYGFRKGENPVKSKPTELASVHFGEMGAAIRQAQALGYVGIFARSKPVRWGQYRLAR